MAISKKHSQTPRRKQLGIKLKTPQGAGYLTLAAVAKCLQAVTWLVAHGNKNKFVRKQIIKYNIIKVSKKQYHKNYNTKNKGADHE